MASLLKQFEVTLTYNDDRDPDTVILTADGNVDERGFVLGCFGPADDTEALTEISSRLVGAIRKGKKLSRVEYAELRSPEFLAKRKGKFQRSKPFHLISTNKLHN